MLLKFQRYQGKLTYQRTPITAYILQSESIYACALCDLPCWDPLMDLHLFRISAAIHIFLPTIMLHVHVVPLATDHVKAPTSAADPLNVCLEISDVLIFIWDFGSAYVYMHAGRLEVAWTDA